jgi:MFS family permease
MTPARAQGVRLDVIVLSNFLALGVIVAAVPRYLHSELSASRFQTGLSTTIYFVAALVMRPFIGAWADRIGRRPFILVPPFVIAVLTIGYEWAGSVPAVALLRLAAGGIAALFFTSVALAATDLAAPERRASALGRQSVMTYTGFAVGPVIADLLIRIGWTWAWLGAVVLHLITGIAAIGLTETRTVTAGAAPARMGFDGRVFRPGVAVLAANFTFAAIVAFLPELAERLGIGSPGALFASYAISVLVMRALTSGVADRMGPARFTIPALGVGFVGLVVLSFASAPWHAFVGVVIVGFGAGSTFPAATAAALARAGTGDRGKAMGTALALGDVGQASSGPLVGLLSQSFGFRWVYGIPAIVVACAIIVMLGASDVGGRRSAGSVMGDPSIS